MADRVPLDVLLAEHEGEEPCVSFDAWRDGRRFEVTAVLERTAVVCQEGGEKSLARHALLTADPGAIRWRPGRTMRQFTGRTLKDSDEARSLRRGSDARARQDQEAHGRPEPAEPAPDVDADPGRAHLERLLADARRQLDELRAEADDYALALRAASQGRRPADPPAERRRRVARWRPVPTGGDALLDELVRLYALADEPGRQAVERRSALRRLRHSEEPRAQSA